MANEQASTPAPNPRTIRIAAVAVLAVVGLSLAVMALRRSQGSGDNESLDLLPPEKLTARRQSQPTPPAPDPRVIDLLDLVDLEKDAMAGKWGFQGRSLVTSAVHSGRIEIPVAPPAEYDLSLTVTRKRGANSLNLGLILLGKPFMLGLDGHDGMTTWLAIAGNDNPETNETSVHQKLLKWNQPTKVDVQVRRGGVTLKVNEKPVLEWKGDPADLTLGSSWFVPHPQALILGSWETTFLVDRMVLTSVDGSVTLLRP